MKYILTLLLLCPVTMHSMESKNRPLEENSNLSSSDLQASHHAAMLAANARILELEQQLRELQQPKPQLSTRQEMDNETLLQNFRLERTKEFFKTLVEHRTDSKGTHLDFKKGELKEYLEARFSQEKTDKELELWLSPDSLKCPLLNLQQSNLNARAILLYASMTQVNTAFTIRSILGCYTTTLVDFETKYKKPLEKVSDEEYAIRLSDATVMQGLDPNAQLLRESKLFSEALLEQFSQSNL